MTRAFACAAGLAALVAVAGCDSEPPAVVQWLTADAPRPHAEARAALRRYGCVHCHTIGQVQGANGLVGPPLTNLRERVYIAGMLPNTEENLVRFIIAPTAFRPGSAMPMTGITEPEARAVVQFLYSGERDFAARMR